MVVDDPGNRRPRGRPRDTASEDRIADAVIDELAGVPYSRVTIDGIARRAGVARSTIYRRYTTKFDLVVGVVGRETGKYVPAPTGDLEADIRQFLATMVKGFESKLGWALANLSAEASHDSDIAAFLARDSNENRRTMNAIFVEARAAGRVRSDVDVDLMTDVLVSIIPYRLRVSRKPFDLEAIEQLTSLVLRGILVDTRQ
jgi:AcrR family transcriptional regulator